MPAEAGPAPPGPRPWGPARCPGCRAWPGPESLACLPDGGPGWGGCRPLPAPPPSCLERFMLISWLDWYLGILCGSIGSGCV